MQAAPEFSETLPPIVHDFGWRDRAQKYRPRCSVAAGQVRIPRPLAEQPARRFAASQFLENARFYARERDHNAAAAQQIAPPESPVPAPPPTIGVSWRFARRAIPATSCAVAGKELDAGVEIPLLAAQLRHIHRASESFRRGRRTAFGPRRRPSSRISCGCIVVAIPRPSATIVWAFGKSQRVGPGVVTQV